MIRAGLIQTRTGLDMERNASELAAAAERLADAGADTIFTPEMCGLLDRNSARLRAAATTEAADPVLAALRDVARRRAVSIAIGSLAIRDEVAAPDGRLANRSFVIGPDGAVLAQTPLNRWGTAMDIAQAAAFLASDRASFITGTDLRVDGGMIPERLGADCW